MYKVFLSFLMFFSVNMVQAEELTDDQIFEVRYGVGIGKRDLIPERSPQKGDMIIILIRLVEQAEQGGVEAQYNLGVMYDDGHGVERDEEEAFYWYRLAAKQGHVDAQFQLGMMYDGGEGVEEDEEEAVYWYGWAAKQGHVEAQYQLGVKYDFGRGVERDEEEAFYWYERAAKQGHMNAQYQLGVMYDDGHGVERDEEEALYWYSLAAEQGHAHAQTQIGVVQAQESTPGEYMGNEVCDVDRVKLLPIYIIDYRNDFDYCIRLAEKGDVIAQYFSGFMYMTGRGTRRNYTEAMSLVARATEKGYAPAQYALGILYGYGKGVEEDDEQALDR